MFALGTAGTNACVTISPFFGYTQAVRSGDRHLTSSAKDSIDGRFMRYSCSCPIRLKGFLKNHLVDSDFPYKIGPK